MPCITRWRKRACPCAISRKTIGARLKLPVKSLAPEPVPGFFGWLSMFATHDMPSSSTLTRSRLGWQPTGPGLLADLENLQV